jgi:hypothetical protein
MSKLNAQFLSKLKRDNILDEQIKIEITEIDAKILNAHEDGNNICVHTLPTAFMVNDCEKNDAKIYVYAELIKSYRDKGFIVKIMLGNLPKLFIKWENRTVNTDLEAKRAIILDCLLK